MISSPRLFLRKLFDCAIAAIDPRKAMEAHLPPPPMGRTVIIAAGKAAAAMMAGFEEATRVHWPADAIEKISGLVLCPPGYGLANLQTSIAEAGYPASDTTGLRAAAAIPALLSGLSKDDLLLVLLSGGSDELLTLPAPGLSLDDKLMILRELLASGASPEQVICVRKHLSAFKGGRLAAMAWPAQVITLTLSDLPGDDPSIISLGPTVADTTTARAALDILKSYRLEIPFAVSQFLRQPSMETPKPNDPRIEKASYTVILRPVDALLAAQKTACSAGITSLVLSDSFNGSIHDAALIMAGIASSVDRLHLPVAPPCVLLAGGMLLSRGCRNNEFSLALALALKSHKNITAISCDTDGLDGLCAAAGALIGPDTLSLAQAKGFNPLRELEYGNAATVFESLNDWVITGPTWTSVNDFHALLIM